MTICRLTLIRLTWRIWWAPNNASKWQMGFNSAFKGLIRLLMRNVSDKSCRENKNTHFMSNNFFFRKSRRLWDNMKKYRRAGQTTDDDIIWRTPCCVLFCLYSAGLLRSCGLTTVWLSVEEGWLVDLRFSVCFPSPLAPTCLRYSIDASL